MIINKMLLSSYLSIHSQNTPRDEAIVFLEKGSDQQICRSSLSWAEFDSASNKVANMLIALGVKKGDRVALVSENSLYWLPIYFGILRSGAIAAVINYRNTEEDILYCLTLADIACAFVSNSVACKLKNAINPNDFLRNYFVLDKDFKTIINFYTSANVNVRIGLNEPAAIYFSSGTTGKSKAVLISHKSLLAAAKTELNNHHQTKQDRFLCLSPLYHAGAKIHWFGSLLVGGCIIISDGRSPRQIANTIYNEKISIVWLLVPQIQDILDFISIGKIAHAKFSTLKLMHSGAQPIPEELIKRWKKEFPNIDYDTNYGLTEATGPGCISLGKNNMEHLGSVGRPSIGWNAKIIDRKNNEVPNGIVGELILSGPGIMIGYYNDSTSTRRALKKGWLYTGDLARKDNDGFIYIEGRIKDTIICGGENIYPIQIENFLRKLEGVKDVAVIGLPNSRMGEVVAIVVEIQENGNLTKKDIWRYCEQLPEYQQPAKIVLGPIYRNSTGKVDKIALKNSILYKKH